MYSASLQIWKVFLQSLTSDAILRSDGTYDENQRENSTS